MKPKDKPVIVKKGSLDEPKLFAVVDDKKFPRPALETYFADNSQNPIATDNRCSCNPVGGVYCQCNKVRVCSCVGCCSRSSSSVTPNV